MRYNNITRTLFGYKLTFVDSFGAKKEEFKLPKNSPLKLKPAAKGGFCFVDKNGETVTSVFSAARLSGSVFTGTTYQGTLMRVNYKTGKTTPEYVYELEHHIVTTDGRVFKVDEHANVSRTPYLAPTSTDGEFRDNRIGENQFVFKGPNGKYVLLDCKMHRVIDMEFDTPVIRNTYNDGPLHAFTAGHKHYFCDKAGNVLKSIDANLEVYKFTSNDPTDTNIRFAAYDRSTNSSIVYCYDPNADKIKIETTLDNRVVERYLDNRKLLYITQNENGKYGLVTRLDKNVIPHIYDSISKENLKTRYLTASRVVSDTIFKVGIYADGQTKYGAYDMEGKSILPTKYANIDLTESTKMADGTYRFMVSSVRDYYGVVDSNGNTLVPLKYIHFPESKTVVQQKTGKGTSIERLVLSRPNGQKVYFNVFANNILATEEEKRSIVTTYQTQKETPSFATRPTPSIYGASFSSNSNDEMAD